MTNGHTIENWFQNEMTSGPKIKKGVQNELTNGHKKLEQQNSVPKLDPEQGDGLSRNFATTVGTTEFGR